MLIVAMEFINSPIVLQLVTNSLVTKISKTSQYAVVLRQQ